MSARDFGLVFYFGFLTVMVAMLVVFSLEDERKIFDLQRRVGQLEQQVTKETP